VKSNLNETKEPCVKDASIVIETIKENIIKIKERLQNTTNNLEEMDYNSIDLNELHTVLYLIGMCHRCGEEIDDLLTHVNTRICEINERYEKHTKEYFDSKK
jgi:hypothetical protein